ncbi:tyrosine-protein phosphatase [Lentilactobacillus dabitei]|uniref:tyrosine-protein phosphatase n=1 Tax=Lentilactobacillus dabitei TaxID=2831523 RepID=UPI0032219656
MNLSQAINVRDLGGYITSNGKHTKWNKLIRAGEMADLSSDDKNILLNYGVNCVIDLRSDAEILKSPDALPSEIEYVQIPLFNDDETESSEVINQMNRLYSRDPHSGHIRMMEVYRKLAIGKQPQGAYQKFFQLLLNSGERQNILFHCSAGKDRTGIIAALILGALGVDEWITKQDYLLTNKLIFSRVQRRIEHAIAANMNAQFITSLFSLSTVSLDYFDAAFAIINYTFGGVQQYLKDWVGLTADDITKLQQIYLEF